MGSVFQRSTSLMSPIPKCSLDTRAGTSPATVPKTCEFKHISTVSCCDCHDSFRKCVFVDNDDILNDLLDNLKVNSGQACLLIGSCDGISMTCVFFAQDILFNLTSLVGWIKSNWYWVLAGFAGLSKHSEVCCVLSPM